MVVLKAQLMTSAHCHGALDHLSSSQLSALIQRYYAGEPIDALLAAFEISCGPGSLWRHFPSVPTGDACPACGSPLVERFRGRTSGARHVPISRCSSCNHRESPECSCSYCCLRRDEAQRTTARVRRTAIACFCQERWIYNIHAVAPTQLSARAAFSLLCIARTGGWIAPNTLGALGNAQPRFAPFEIDFCSMIPATVIANQLAAPDPESPFKAFPDDTGCNLSWSEEQVQWRLLMKDPTNFMYELESLVSEQRWPKGWIEEVRSLWVELAVAECVEFCVLRALQQDLPTPCHTALSSLLKNLLIDYSASQTFELLATAISDTTEFVERTYIASPQAARFMIDACQRLADRARLEKIEVKGLSRDPMLGRTQASYVLHDLFLGLGEAGFSQVIPRS